MSETPPVPSSGPLPIALDAMGGDHGAPVNVEGAVAAAREDGAHVVLVGDEAVLRRELDRLGAASLLDGPLSIRHAPEVIEMDEKPAQAVRKKKGSSMRVACDLVKGGEACGAVSAGNSGAMMAVALLVFGRLDGVIRPCIATAFPSKARAGFSVLVDAGANTDCSPEHLFQFGVMGAVYIEKAYGSTRPAVGVLANGTEDTKGTDLTRDAVKLLRETDLNVLGHIEGNQIMFGEVDVAVTDGFTGNVVLKTGEGVAKFVADSVKAGFLEGGPLVKLAGLFAQGMLRKLKSSLDYREFGAAPLLGLAAPAFIAHGSSDAYAIRKAIGAVRRHAQNDITQHIETAIRHWAPITEGPHHGDSAVS